MSITIPVAAGASPTISGNATASLIKANTGTLRLTGVNTYGGATTVSAGTLDVAEGSINGTSGISVAAGAAFIYDSATDLTPSISLVSGSRIGGDGTYTLINNSGNFSNISNFGLANAADIGGGRSAYFQNGSLQLVVVPEPATWLLGLAALAGLARMKRSLSRSRR